MTILFGSLNLLHSSRKPKVASTKHEAQRIPFVCKETFAREGSLKGEYVVSFLTLKRHMTPLGNMAL